MNSYFEGLRKGIRVVGYNETVESYELESLKLESFCLSWKEPSEDRKFPTSARTFKFQSFQFHFGLSNLKFRTSRFFPNFSCKRDFVTW